MCVRLHASYVVLASVDLNHGEKGNCKNVTGWEVKKMEYAALTTSIMGMCKR
jgi:hypothetical protein